jgi:transcriptional regulator with XRE-family HTH domain
MTERDTPYKTHEQVVQELLEDPEVREAYEELQPEYELKKAIIRARLNGSLTQAELAERMGVKQPAVARMETGPFDPRLTTLRKLASALGVRFEIGAEGLQVIPAGGEEADPQRHRLERTA